MIVAYVFAVILIVTVGLTFFILAFIEDEREDDKYIGGRK